MAFCVSRIGRPSTICNACVRVRVLPQIKPFSPGVRSISVSSVAVPKIFHSYRSFSSSTASFEPRGSRDTGADLTVQERENTNSVVRVFAKDEEIVRQIQHFENEDAMELMSFIETVDPSQLNHRAIEVFARVVSVTAPNETAERKKRILKSVGMQKMCHRIRKTCRTMDATLLVTLAKVFGLLGAPGNHPTFQLVLSLLSKQTNSMELGQIVFLNFILQNLKTESNSTLSEALKLALPVVFESQVKEQLTNNPKDLANCLAFALYTKCSDATVARIADMFLKVPEEEITVEQAVDIHKFLCDGWRWMPETEALVGHALSVIARHVPDMDDAILSKVLGRCASRVIRGTMSFYNEDFADACCDRFVESTNTFQVLRGLGPISILRHVHIGFLEKCADIAASEPQIILNDDNLFLSLIRGFSGAAYKPEKWNILEQMLLEHPATTKDNYRQDISLIVDYLVLDTLPLNLLEKVFSPESQHRLDDWLEKSGPYTPSIIHSAVKQLHPEYTGPLPPESMVERWTEAKRNQIKNFKHTLKAPLETAFGGESYVLTGLVCGGLHIDHCIVMRPGGYPVAIQNRDACLLEDIERPANSTLVLIKVFGLEAYATNTRRLRGIHNLESRILRSFGHAVVEVDVNQWKELPENEKIPYLVREIRDKVEKV